MLLDVLEEHLEELDFLWEQREGLLRAADWTLPELAAHEGRAEAHLDGLRIGGDAAAAIARPLLHGEERSAATAATLVLMSLGLAAEVLDAAMAAAPEIRDGIRIGLRHADVRGIAARLSEMASSGEPGLRALAADVLAFHRLPAPKGLAELRFAEDPEIRAVVYGAIGRFGGPWSVDLLTGALRQESTALRRAALEASARLGLPNLGPVCARAATGETPVPEAVAFCGVVGGPEAEAALEAALRQPATAGAALRGLGALGRAGRVPLLLEAMSDPALAPAAGAAFLRIVGPGEILADAPPAPDPGMSEDEADLRDETPPPDPEKARRLWESRSGRFAPDRRWQGGQDVTEAFGRPVFDALSLEARCDLYFRARSMAGARAADLEIEARAARQVLTSPGATGP
jgi:uncharacterized protein (TIGR02270 family)